MEKNIEELNLIKLAQSGDDGAIDALYEKYKHFVAGLARKYYLIGGDSDDLMQEGMLGFFKAINTFDVNKNDFLPYAKTLIVHQILNAIRKANAGKESFLNDRMPLNNQGEVEVEENKVVGLPDPSFMPESEFMIGEQVADLMNMAQTKLSKCEYEILKLYLQGYDNKDIMKKLNITYKSVDNGLNRIKKKLKNIKNMEA